MCSFCISSMVPMVKVLSFASARLRAVRHNSTSVGRIIILIIDIINKLMTYTIIQHIVITRAFTTVLDKAGTDINEL